jgi:molybdenum cofactor cytidylyltransferase
MGRPKTELVLEGRTLLQHALDNALASGLGEIVVVLRADDGPGRAFVASRCDERLRAVTVAGPVARQSDSLRAGIAALSDRIEIAAVLLADQPDVDATLIDRMIDAAERSSRAAIRPVHVFAGVRTPGHPVMLTRRLFARLGELAGDEGARALFRDDAAQLDEIELHSAPPCDVDTPDDWSKLVDAWASRSA